MNPGISPTTHYINLLRCLVPEKSGELDALLRRLDGLKFIDDERAEGISFWADPARRTVSIGHKALGRLWACSLAYFCIYTEIGNIKTLEPTARDFDLSSTERFRKAQRLLSWAVNNEIAVLRSAVDGLPPHTVEMPTDLPQPFAESTRGSDEHCADETCLVALGWIVFHEIMHIEQNHENYESRIDEALRQRDYEAAQRWSTESIRQEKEADMRAADWVLSGVVDDAPRLLKRGIGVMVGLVWLASREVYRVKSRGEYGTHPPTPERLYQVIKQYFPSEEEDSHALIWNFSQLMLNLHLQSYGIQLDSTRQFSSFEEAANDAIERIFRRKRD